jgi:hypothetical protein
MPLENINPLLLDTVYQRMWMAADWSWTLGNIPAFTVVQNKTDYEIARPGDFLYIVQAKIVTSNNSDRDLIVDPRTEDSVIQAGQASRISAMTEGDTQFYRLSPVPTQQVAAPQAPKVIGLYKKQGVKITADNYETAILVFPDAWFYVYCLGVLAYAYTWADDERGGSASIGSDGRYQFSGKMAEFEMGLELMKKSEPLPTTPSKTVQDTKKER